MKIKIVAVIQIKSFRTTHPADFACRFFIACTALDKAWDNVVRWRKVQAVFPCQEYVIPGKIISSPPSRLPAMNDAYLGLSVELQLH